MEEKLLQQILAKLDTMDQRFDGIDKRFDEQKEILNAVRAAQEFQKAEIDGLNIRVAKIENKLDRMADDITFLVRKASEHEQDIRELQKTH